LLDLGASENVYEKSRSKSREYIRDQLILGGVPQQKISWHKFEWKERKSNGLNITTTTWSGINIVVWSNTTAIENSKVRIFGAHYDTSIWSANNTKGAYNNLVGASILIKLVNNIFEYQKKENNTATEVPFLFIFFDHLIPGVNIRL
jgi:hypothetical protein